LSSSSSYSAAAATPTADASVPPAIAAATATNEDDDDEIDDDDSIPVVRNFAVVNAANLSDEDVIDANRRLLDAISSVEYERYRDLTLYDMHDRGRAGNFGADRPGNGLSQILPLSYEYRSRLFQMNVSGFLPFSAVYIECISTLLFVTKNLRLL
jgi:hypothetical protein